MSRSSKDAKPQAHTMAWLSLEDNLESLSHMVSLERGEMMRLIADLNRTRTYLSKATKNAVNGKLGKPVIRSLERAVDRVKTRIDRAKTATLWQVVILVTCVETYLQDVLSAAAGVDPEVMKTSEQRALYKDVVAATSLDALASKLRTRWARGWLADGGPSRWIKRLERMGARGYSAEVGPRLDFVWAFRNVVVHAAGHATSDFAKRYPHLSLSVGDHLRINSKGFGQFLRQSQEFLESTESFFLARFPSLAETAKPQNEAPARSRRRNRSTDSTGDAVSPAVSDGGKEAIASGKK